MSNGLGLPVVMRFLSAVANAWSIACLACLRTFATWFKINAKPMGRLTPFGLFLPDTKDLSLWMTTSKVTSDFIVDRLEEWWGRQRDNHRAVQTLLLDLDNGQENHWNRSQFLYRLVRFAQTEQ